MDFSFIVLSLVGALVVFLLGVTMLSESTKAIAGEHLERWIKKFTHNIWTGILTGTVLTAILDSSSLVIVMVIALVSASLLSFRSSIGVVMGANIGTTLSSQIIALRLNEYSALLLLPGLIIYLTSDNYYKKNVGRLLLGLGMIFYGLMMMDHAVYPLRNYEPFLAMMMELENPLKGIGMGGLFTLVIQSSSATVAIVISFVSQNLLAIKAGVAVMLGAEIGTVSDTLLASLGRSKETIRTAVFHLFFNVFTVIIGWIFIDYLVSVINYLGGPPAQQIAYSHILFNVGGVLLMAPLANYWEMLIFLLIPEKHH